MLIIVRRNLRAAAVSSTNKAVASLPQAQEREFLENTGCHAKSSLLFVFFWFLPSRSCRSLAFTTWTLSLAQMVTLMKYISTKSSWRPISTPSYVIALSPSVLIVNLTRFFVLRVCVPDSFWSASLGRALPVLHLPNAVRPEIYPLCRCAPPRPQAGQPSRECGLRAQNL